MPRKPTWPPRIYARRGKDYCQVRLPGGKYREYGLGPSGGPAARAEYLRLVAELEANRRAPLERGPDVTVVEVAAAFEAHAAARHHPKQLGRVRAAFDRLDALYGDTPAAEFTPARLEAVRGLYVSAGYCRNVVNSMTSIVRQAWRWAVVKGMVRYEVAAALAMLPDLRRGESAAPDRPKVLAAPLADVEATLPRLPPAVADMARVQLLTGMRPGELCALRPADVDQNWKSVGGVALWLYTPQSHKTGHRGHDRRVVIGPRAQAVLLPYLARDAEAHCFSPLEVRTAWNVAHGRAARFGKKRFPGTRYTASAYAKCVRHACDRAGVPRWSPNRLRHAAATLIQTGWDRESARCVLGHASAEVTGVYAETLDRAALVIAKLG